MDHWFARALTSSSLYIRTPRMFIRVSRVQFPRKAAECVQTCGRLAKSEVILNFLTTLSINLTSAQLEVNGSNSAGR